MDLIFGAQQEFVAFLIVVVIIVISIIITIVLSIVAIDVIVRLLGSCQDIPRDVVL